MYIKFAHLSIKNVKGPSTRYQIEHSFKNALILNYNTLILGSSKFYRGINPDLIDSSFNFSHDNDIFNQLYYKLQFLEANNKKFDVLILGYDYFGFSYISDTRNYIYEDYFATQYSEDYRHKASIDKRFNSFITMNFTQTFKPFRIGLFKNPVPNMPYITEKGQYVRFGIASPYKSNTEKDSAKILDVQVKYFYKIVSYCKQKKIQLILVMIPARKIELENYTKLEMKKVDNVIKLGMSKYPSTCFLDYCNDSSFHTADFEDELHLNKYGADKISIKLNNDIKNLIQRQ
jgi:hypothetical protein